MAGGTGAGGGIATTAGREARAFLHELAQLQAGGGEEVGCEVGGAGAAQQDDEGDEDYDQDDEHYHHKM